MPCNRLDLSDFAGIEQGIRSTTERGPDIESNNKLSPRASVRGAVYTHDESERTATKSFINLGLLIRFLGTAAFSPAG